MWDFTFDMPPDSTHFFSVEDNRYQRILMEKAERIKEADRIEQEEQKRRTAMCKSRVVTLRVPAELLEAIDAVARSAATNRGHLIRQIVADYLNYIRTNGVDYRGSFLRHQHVAERKV